MKEFLKISGTWVFVAVEVKPGMVSVILKDPTRHGTD